MVKISSHFEIKREAGVGDSVLCRNVLWDCFKGWRFTQFPAQFRLDLASGLNDSVLQKQCKRSLKSGPLYKANAFRFLDIHQGVQRHASRIHCGLDHFSAQLSLLP